MIEKIKDILIKILINLGIEDPKVNLEHPEDISHGDYSSNIAMIYAKNLKINPKTLAEKIAEEFKKEKPNEVDSIEIAGPGFINFKIADSYFTREIIEISKNAENFGKISIDKGKKIMVEYTDPNPFKEFHIGHLMSNAIGESISRLIEFSGAEVKKANWQGDVGPHVAKAVWGVMDLTTDDWGEAYTKGSEAYENDPEAKKEIDIINKEIYEKSDPEINILYEKGRKESLDKFEIIYKKLGTKFDNYFFESKEGRNGEVIVKEFLKKGIFEESEGAVVFKGEKYALHTRVFLTSAGLPTYEAKELGLNVEKFKIYPDLDESIIITANEQSAYFDVLLKVFSLIFPDISKKTKHISHGMLRLSSGKMSSRKGGIISAESLIREMQELVREKMAERKFDNNEADEISQIVAIGAVKYSILRQAIGGNIVYDPNKAVSFEGDSGPYLQYACVRANAVIKKSEEAGILKKVSTLPKKAELLEKLLVRFPETVEKSRTECAPHHIVTYLIELASAFNSYYAQNQIISEKDPVSSYRVALTKVFAEVMKNGLWVLGIKVPERM